MTIKILWTAAALAMLLAGPAWADDDQDGQGGGRYGHRYDRRGDDIDQDRRPGYGDHDWRHEGGRRHDDEWRHHDNWRYDGWRYDRGRDDNYWRRGRDWRYAPPVRYRADYGYRCGYELAWRDWDRYGRYDRRWHRRPEPRYRFDFGYLSGYEAGWRDAEYYFGYGYRPRYWARDPYGSWFFSFGLSG